MPHKLKLTLLVLLSLAMLALVALVPRAKNVRLTNGVDVHVIRASLARSMFPEANTAISFKTREGQIGTVVLWQDVFDGPVAILPARQTNVLLCLYDFDVNYRLFRIDVSKNFDSLPKDSGLNDVLFSSTCAIEEGSQADWFEFMSDLQRGSSTDFAHESIPLYMRVGGSSQAVISRLRAEGHK